VEVYRDKNVEKKNLIKEGEVVRYEYLVAKNKSVERSADYKEINVDEIACW
jgi:hypothetical protein